VSALILGKTPEDFEFFQWRLAKKPGDKLVLGLVGRTHTARVTIALLEINRLEAVEFREYLIREGSFQPG
jgi:hypothetical protein